MTFLVRVDIFHIPRVENKQLGKGKCLLPIVIFPSFLLHKLSLDLISSRFPFFVPLPIIIISFFTRLPFLAFPILTSLFLFISNIQWKELYPYLTTFKSNVRSLRALCGPVVMETHGSYGYLHPHEVSLHNLVSRNTFLTAEPRLWSEISWAETNCWEGEGEQTRMKSERK